RLRFYSSFPAMIKDRPLIANAFPRKRRRASLHRITFWNGARNDGSSLLLVLWAIMLMSFAVIGLVAHLSRGLDESIRAEKEFRARLLLQSARTLAAQPEVGGG